MVYNFDVYDIRMEVDFLFYKIPPPPPSHDDYVIGHCIIPVIMADHENTMLDELYQYYYILFYMCLLLVLQRDWRQPVMLVQCVAVLLFLQVSSAVGQLWVQPEQIHLSYTG